jgi:hypothetical protein
MDSIFILLAVGPRYVSKDFNIKYLHALDHDSSGVQSKLDRERDR